MSEGGKGPVIEMLPRLNVNKQHWVAVAIGPKGDGGPRQCKTMGSSGARLVVDSSVPKVIYYVKRNKFLHNDDQFYALHIQGVHFFLKILLAGVLPACCVFTH